MLEALYRAWASVEGEALMVASDNHNVEVLNLRARTDRVALGEVEAAGVVLHDGTVAGVGDLVVTRQNDRSLGVANRERWSVTERGDDGSLRLVNLRNNTERALPPDYVADHVELSYAVTGHGAQGLTVEQSLALVQPEDDRSYLYVAMTRGREHNMAFVVTDEWEEEPLGHGESLRASEVLQTVLDRDRPASALSALEIERRRAEEELQTMRERWAREREQEVEWER